MNKKTNSTMQCKTITLKKWTKGLKYLLFADCYGKEVSKYLRKYYTPESKKLPISGKRVIYTFNEQTKFNVGLADRLRGIISAYDCIKELNDMGKNIDFSINFTKPFQLTDYLVPNKYDWSIAPSDISYNSTQVESMHISATEYIKSILGRIRFDAKHLRKYLKKHISESKFNQIHLHSNIEALSNVDYSKLFNELFKPSNMLQETLNAHCQALSIGGGYISASFRFMDLLGDFNEGSGLTLKPDEQEVLMSECTKQLEILHTKHPNKRILVTSDSGSFLKYAATKLPYVYIVEGDITHVGHSSDSSFELHLKTFVDLLMIARAEKVYLLRTGEMYKSGFSKSASRIYNTEFEYIEF